MEEIFQKLYPAFRSNILAIGLGMIGLIFLSIGLISSFNTQPQEEITFQAADEKTETIKRKIVVDVSGAVGIPGVYSVNEGDRIQDALILASGLSGDADREWVSKNLNLAQKLSDGTKIYIPSRGEVSLRETSSMGIISASSLININSAALSELDTLSGIGPVTAQKIIDNRPYSKIEDLTLKKVVTSKVFDKIKDKISVY